VFKAQAQAMSKNKGTSGHKRPTQATTGAGSGDRRRRPQANIDLYSNLL